MKLTKTTLRSALGFFTKGAVVLIKFQGEYYRLQTFDPTDPMHVLCKLELNDQYRKEVLWIDTEDTLVITLR